MRVESSSLFCSTIYGSLAQLVSASFLHSEGHQFKSDNSQRVTINAVLSFSGRTSGFGPENVGSIPAGTANYKIKEVI